MVAALFLSALLSLTDPAGDAVGNGSLTAPTATSFRSADAFDIRSITVPDTDTFGFRLELGALPPPEAFPQAMIEIYLHDAGVPTPGQNALLPGSGMRLPEGVGWHLAFQFVAGELSVFAPDARGAAQEVSEALEARVEVEGNTLVVTTDAPIPRRFSLYGLSGAFDPFSDSGWRALRREASPWGFSSVDQQFPVLDVIADTYAQQQQALAQGVLPEIRASFTQERWLLLTGAGMLIALAGLTARFFVRNPRQELRQASRPAAAAPVSAPRPGGPLAPLTPASLSARAEALHALKGGGRESSLHLLTSSTSGPRTASSAEDRDPTQAAGEEAAATAAVETEAAEEADSSQGAASL